MFTGLDNGVIEGSGAMDDWEEFFVPLISQSGPIARMFYIVKECLSGLIEAL